MQADPEIALEAITRCEGHFVLPHELFANPTFITAMVQVCVTNIRWVIDDSMITKEIALEAVRNDGTALADVPVPYCKNLDVY